MPMSVDFDLSFDKSRIGETGSLTASCYIVDGINDGDRPRLLSIGQLVMALCLSRATALEAEIIKIVESLDNASCDLERLTEIEKRIVESTEGSVDLVSETLSDGTTYRDFLLDQGIAVPGYTASSSSEQLITDIEAKMDSLNSFSQQTMIDLQAMTGKRDQSYDMVSNILKSLYATLTTNVNNM